MGSHPVAVVQYTYTHKQYRERHKTIHRTTQKLERVWAVPRLCGFYPGICLTTEENHRKTSVKVVRHEHTMRIHTRNNNNT